MYREGTYLQTLVEDSAVPERPLDGDLALAGTDVIVVVDDGIVAAAAALVALPVELLPLLPALAPVVDPVDEAVHGVVVQ